MSTISSSRQPGRPKKKTSGNKKIDKWIETNLFAIYEYCESPGYNSKQNLDDSLSAVLKTVRNNLDYQRTTKFGNTVNISWRRGKWVNGHFTLTIYKKKRIVII